MYLIPILMPVIVLLIITCFVVGLVKERLEAKEKKELKEKELAARQKKEREEFEKTIHEEAERIKKELMASKAEYIDSGKYFPILDEYDNPDFYEFVRNLGATTITADVFMSSQFYCFYDGNNIPFDEYYFYKRFEFDPDRFYNKFSQKFVVKNKTLEDFDFTEFAIAYRKYLEKKRNKAKEDMKKKITNLVDKALKENKEEINV